MHLRKSAVVALLTVTALALTGCLGMSGRTGNQGGSNILQATAKLAADNLSGLNPDDIQVLADLAMDFANIDIPEVTDEQAAAVVSFLEANNVTTIASLQALIQQAEEDPESIVIPDDVRAVIEAITADPSAYIDALSQF
jgi:hypothetical protein